jgi:hypothetical protein
MGECFDSVGVGREVDGVAFGQVAVDLEALQRTNEISSGKPAEFPDSPGWPAIRRRFRKFVGFPQSSAVLRPCPRPTRTASSPPPARLPGKQQRHRSPVTPPPTIMTSTTKSPRQIGYLRLATGEKRWSQKGVAVRSFAISVVAVATLPYQ